MNDYGLLLASSFPGPLSLYIVLVAWAAMIGLLLAIRINGLVRNTPFFIVSVIITVAAWALLFGYATDIMKMWTSATGKEDDFTAMISWFFTEYADKTVAVLRLSALAVVLPTVCGILIAKLRKLAIRT